jgi:hypothetical protein
MGSKFSFFSSSLFVIAGKAEKIQTLMPSLMVVLVENCAPELFYFWFLSKCVLLNWGVSV